MYTPARLHEVLYVSTIAPAAPISIVADIAPKARIANQASEITGLLIFDGMRFCQQLEGGPKAVLSLMERICQDPRHTNIEILHQGPLAERRFQRFSLGYIAIDEVDVLERMEQVDGQEAMEAFMALLPDLDLDA
ncbi:MAG: BLUF domain-containing protein [Polaromonas sp.]